MTAITFGEICLQGFYSFEVKTIQKGVTKAIKSKLSSSQFESRL